MHHEFSLNTDCPQFLWRELTFSTFVKVSFNVFCAMEPGWMEY
ncbi:hypothetical protein L579_1540 [Pantoea sp. AS-PWVM4]|nr:hypothetical protein L579_1540 [Pantoea sp. AS-PWVM4]